MILLRDGLVYDGSGADAREASVLIDGDRIRAVGRIAPSPEMEVVDCAGLAIAPGFIDVHSHADLEVLEHRPEKIRQGVTTEVVGNCGFSLFPRIDAADLVPSFDLFERRGSRTWCDAAAYFEDIHARGSRTNAASLTGHAGLRGSVLGMAAVSAGGAPLARMEAVLAECLEQGSIGLSTGLNEVPSSYADLEELTALCRVVRRFGGLYTSHLRDYKFRLLEAVEEALELGRRTGVRVELSHLQAVGRKNWDTLDTVLERIEKAHAGGVDAGMDAYPYIAGSCQLTQVLPTWALDGGTAALLARLGNRAARSDIRDQTEAGMANGWEDIVVSSVESPGAARLIGRTIQEIAGERGAEGVETALSLLEEYNGRVRIISFNQSDENLRKVLTHALTVIITDGLWTEGKPHPRTFGTYPLFLGEYVLKRGWMDLPHAIHKITALPARRFLLEGRGSLQPGNFADVTVFRAETVGTEASYMEPDRPPEGIVHVMVNGQWGVRDELLQDHLPGIAVRRGAM